MTTLLVKGPPDSICFPPKWSFVNVDPKSSDVRESIQASLKRLVFESEHSMVCIASYDGRMFAFKFCFGKEHQDDFEREAHAYQTDLVKLQGKVIPRFYGYYKATTRPTFPPGPLSCLVLEYCGESVQPFFKLHAAEKIKILETLGRMHRHGFHHSDFNPDNVVVRNGKYRIIDFHAIEKHKCRWRKGYDWKPGEYVLRSGTTPCGALWNVAYDMEVWRDTPEPQIEIAYKWYADIENYPPQEVVNSLIPSRFMHVEPNRKLLREWLRKFKTKMDDNPEADIDALVEEYKREPPDFPYKFTGPPVPPP